MKQSLEIIKDLFISVLFVACIVLILCVLFYDKTSLSKVIPESEEFLISNEMEQDLAQGDLDASKEVVVNYYIDASDLKKYEKTNEYIKGKSNPFAAVVDTEDNTDEDENVAEGDKNQSSNTNNGSQGGFYEDDGMK